MQQSALMEQSAFENGLQYACVRETTRGKRQGEEIARGIASLDLGGSAIARGLQAWTWRECNCKGIASMDSDEVQLQEDCKLSNCKQRTQQRVIVQL
jgi:hypothetical protein